MNKIIIALLLLSSSCAFADPHYFQALHPYWDEESYKEYIGKYDAPITIITDVYQSDIEGNMHIYVYIFNQENIAEFTLEIPCPNRKTKITDISEKSSNAEIYSKFIYWPLNSKIKKQAVWFYSIYPPADRKYIITKNDKTKKNGLIKGPACK